MNTTPPNNGPRNNGPDHGPNGGQGNGPHNGPGDSGQQDPRWDAFDEGQPKGDQPFNASNPYAQHGGGAAAGNQQPGQPGQSQAQPGQPQGQPNQSGQPGQAGQPGQQGSPYGQVNNGGQNPYAQNPQGPGQPGMNGAAAGGQGFGNGPGQGDGQGFGAGAGMGAAGAGTAGAGSGAGGADPNKKKGNKGAVIAAAIGGAMVLIIGGIAACQANDDEENAAETSQTQPAETTSVEAAEDTTEETTSAESATEESAEASESGAAASDNEERDPTKGRSAGTVPFDELEDGDEITLGEGLGPSQTWGTYDGKVVAIPEAVDDPGAPSNDLELAKQYAVYYAYQDLKSKAVVTQRLTDTSARYMQTFTPEVAQKAVEESDIDWKAIALAEAKKYKERWPDDPDERLFGMLVDQDEFTEEEAQYAMDNLDK